MDQISFLIVFPPALLLALAPVLCAKSPVNNEHGATGGRGHWHSSEAMTRVRADAAAIVTGGTGCLDADRCPATGASKGPQMHEGEVPSTVWPEWARPSLSRGPREKSTTGRAEKAKPASKPGSKNGWASGVGWLGR